MTEKQKNIFIRQKYLANFINLPIYSYRKFSDKEKILAKRGVVYGYCFSKKKYEWN